MSRDKDIRMLEAICEATARVDAETDDFTPEERERADRVRNVALARLRARQHARMPAIADVVLVPATPVSARIRAMGRKALVAALAALECEHQVQLAFRHSQSELSDDDLRRLLETLSSELTPN
jgi:hypothetical protein